MTAAFSFAFLSCYAAWMMVALAQPTHWESVAGPARRGAPNGVVMRGLGGLLAAMSGILCVGQDGWSFGLLMWGGIACLTAILVTLTLACVHPRDGFGFRDRRNRKSQGRKPSA